LAHREAAPRQKGANLIDDAGTPAQASMPIRQDRMLARRVSTWLRDHF
jgi:hypothetical protein